MNDQSFVTDMTNEVAELISHHQHISEKTAKEEFSKSKSYTYLVDQPQLYSHEGPDYFYDLWVNEKKYGKPIESVSLELMGKI